MIHLKLSILGWQHLSSAFPITFLQRTLNCRCQGLDQGPSGGQAGALVCTALSTDVKQARTYIILPLSSVCGLVSLGMGCNRGPSNPTKNCWIRGILNDSISPSILSRHMTGKLGGLGDNNTLLNASLSCERPERGTNWCLASPSGSFF